jgi:hypothetical protein
MDEMGLVHTYWYNCTVLTVGTERMAVLRVYCLIVISMYGSTIVYPIALRVRPIRTTESTQYYYQRATILSTGTLYLLYSFIFYTHLSEYTFMQYIT